MPTLIKNKQAIADEWQLLAKDADYPAAKIAAGEKLLLPLSAWLNNLDTLKDKDSVGVWLDSDDTVDALAEHCNSLKLIAINFPVFADGRGYSLARQLRDHLGYTGELRAIGDVARDQMFFYQRVGFNSFSLRDDQSAEGAVHSLDDFQLVYQAAADDRHAIHSKQ